MDVDVVYTSEAEEDLTKAYEYYENCRVGLGEEFLSCIRAAEAKIRRSPSSFARIDDRYRGFLIRRFPYLMIYDFEIEVVTVYMIFHTSRNPDSRSKRLR